MPIRDPRKYRDKTFDWMDFFTAARVRELKPLVTEALLAEHAEDPRGGDTRHSTALQDVLNFVHNLPTDGKSFAYAELPYAKYRLGILRARGVAPTIHKGRTFRTEREAVHAVFIERLEALGLLAKGGAPKAANKKARRSKR